MSQTHFSITIFDSVTVASTITRPANTTTYTVNDVLSNVTDDAHCVFEWTKTPIRFPLSGLISGAIAITSVSAATPPDIDLLLFDVDIAEVADNAQLNLSDAEARTAIGKISFPAADWAAQVNNRACYKNNLGIQFNARGRFLYGQPVLRNAYAPPSNSEVFTFKLNFAKDTG